MSAYNYDDPGEDETFLGFFGELLEAENEEERQSALSNQIARLRELVETDRGLACKHVPTLVRLSRTCPFPEVRKAYHEFLDYFGSVDARYANLQPSKPGPSRFIDPSKTAMSDTSHPNHKAAMQVFEDIFLATGRLTHLEEIMGWHPSFLQTFTITMNLIMRDDGPLPLSWRNYLAILAASRYRCEYLVSLQEAEFLANGGDPSWLKGVRHAPKKVQTLLELNAILAHQPWMLKQEHIERLASQKGPDSWSISELVHAIVILTIFHALSGFVAAMGLNLEIDMADLTTHQSSLDPASSASSSSSSSTSSTSSSSSLSASASVSASLASLSVSPALPSTASSPSLVSPSSADEKKQLQDDALKAREYERLLDEKSRQSQNGGGGGVGVGVGGGGNHEGEQLLKMLASKFDATVSGQEREKAFNSAGDAAVIVPEDEHEANNPISPSEALGSSTLSSCMSGIKGFSFLSLGSRGREHRYMSPHKEEMKVNKLSYAPFDVNSKNYKIFYLHDYSWKEHGFALVNRFYLGVGQLIDQEMDHIYKLTYNSVANTENVDTTPFREAIWYYTLRLMGMWHDDYNYNKLPIFLSEPVKMFVKKIACDPETLTEADFQLKGYSFRLDEKCHIALLTMEAHRQAALLYALLAVMKNVTK